MIRLYAFYSVGGYRDMYLGDLTPEAKDTYYLSLLPIMIKRNRPEEVEKVAWLKTLPKIEIITSSESYGFPKACEPMFSQGGYVMLCTTLGDGSVCTAFRDLDSSTVDEEGRSTPFSLIFVATGKEDIALTDSLALYCKDHPTEIRTMFTQMIGYDIDSNGLKANLAGFYSILKDYEGKIGLVHMRGRTDLLLCTDPRLAETAIKNLGLDKSRINAICTVDGKTIYGRLRTYTTNVNPEENSTEDTTEDTTDDDNTDTTDKQEVEEKISDSVKTEDPVDTPKNEGTQNTNLVESQRRVEASNAKTDLFGFQVPTSLLKWIIAGALVLGCAIGMGIKR